jgi:TPR repeat protein
MLPKIPLLIGVVGLGAVATTGTWFKRQTDARHRGEVAAIQAEIADLKRQAVQYHERFANLRWNAAKLREAAEATSAEPEKSWARERANIFERFVQQLDRAETEERFLKAVNGVETLCAEGNISDARDQFRVLQPPQFPSPLTFRALQTETYLRPLADFSRQNPAYFRALKTNEPTAAAEEIAKLRAQLASADLETVTPQALVQFELLSAVLPAEDPLIADWSAVANAADYFDAPDAATLHRWRAAKKAMRLHDWQSAAAEMQAITVSTTRTRQAFRAAYGKALLRNRPDQPGEAYPFLVEAAASGDAEARAWVARQDMNRGRPKSALRWLEDAVNEGDTSVVPDLLTLYAMPDEERARDFSREAGFLRRITVGPDAPALASLLLGRLYEEGKGMQADAPKALACYVRAASKKSGAAAIEAARCYRDGIGGAADLDEARDWAVRAFGLGETEHAAVLLIELLQRTPERTALAVQEMFEHEQVAAPAGFNEQRLTGPSVARLRLQIARFFDQRGLFGTAAKFYAGADSHDASAGIRHAELTAAHPCPTCGATGKVQTAVPCPTCDGKGTVTCSACDGRGYNLVPGSPPCTTCGGTGATMQEGHRVSCGVCGGSGKGKGSVIKQPCASCSAGRAVCHDCTGGRILVTKECPDCHGVGSRALADK